MLNPVGELHWTQQCREQNEYSVHTPVMYVPELLSVNWRIVERFFSEYRYRQSNFAYVFKFQLKIKRSNLKFPDVGLKIYLIIKQ